MDDTRYKTFWRRFGAALVDAIVVSPTGLVVTIIAAALVAPFSERAALATSMLGGCASLVYAPYFHARWGQTVGKMACGVRVVPASRESGRISTAQAIVRELPNIMLFVIVAGGFVGVVVSDNTEIMRVREDDTIDFDGRAALWLLALGSISFLWLLAEAATMALNRRRRSIHDFLAGTVVVKTAYKDQPWPVVYDDQIVFPAANATPGLLEVPAFVPAPPTSQVHLRYRVAWDRFWAAVIDGIVYLSCWAVPGGVILFSVDSQSLSAALGTIGLAGYATYDVVLHARGGKTVGKMALGITVVDAATLGPITWRQAWLRSTGLWLGVVTTLVSAAALAAFDAPHGSDFSYSFLPSGVNQWDLAALIVMLVSPQRRALHDLIAGTAVVKDAYMPWPAYIPGSSGGLPPAYVPQT